MERCCVMICGKEAPDGSTFCPYCGKNPVEDSSGNTKPFVISLSKRNLILLASAAAVLLITIPILLVVFLWSGGPRSVPADQRYHRLFGIPAAGGKRKYESADQLRRAIRD